MKTKMSAQLKWSLIASVVMILISFMIAPMFISIIISGNTMGKELSWNQIATFALVIGLVQLYILFALVMNLRVLFNRTKNKNLAAIIAFPLSFITSILVITFGYEQDNNVSKFLYDYDDEIKKLSIEEREKQYAKKPGLVMYIAAIVAVVIIPIMFLSIFALQITPIIFTDGVNTSNTEVAFIFSSAFTTVLFTIIGLLIVACQIPAVVLCVKLLKNDLKSKKLVGIFTTIAFAPVGLFILMDSFVYVKRELINENSIS